MFAEPAWESELWYLSLYVMKTRKELTPATDHGSEVTVVFTEVMFFTEMFYFMHALFQGLKTMQGVLLKLCYM